MSATQRRLGSVGSQLLRTRSGEVVIPGTEIVVRPRFLGTRPEIPRPLISRATRFAADPLAAAAELDLDAWSAIGATALVVDLFDQLAQAGVLDVPPRGGTSLGCVVARRAHLEYPAEHRDRMVCPLGGDEAMHDRYLARS